jgi:hypothetical protein
MPIRTEEHPQRGRGFATVARWVLVIIALIPALMSALYFLLPFQLPTHTLRVNTGSHGVVVEVMKYPPMGLTYLAPGEPVPWTFSIGESQVTVTIH